MHFFSELSIDQGLNLIHKLKIYSNEKTKFKFKIKVIKKSNF